MVGLRCMMNNYYSGEKGGKLSLRLSPEEAKKFEPALTNFHGKPLLLTIDIDAPKMVEQLKMITDEQRKKVYALFKDIGNHFGYELEEAKNTIKERFCEIREIEMFSLSDCTKDLATDFVDWMIEFCVENNVQLLVKPTEYITEGERLTYACLKHGVCQVCGRAGEVHHAQQIGTKYERGNPDDEKLLDKLCLCRTCHNKAHEIGRETFLELHHLTPIKYWEGEWVR